MQIAGARRPPGESMRSPGGQPQESPWAPSHRRAVFSKSPSLVKHSTAMALRPCARMRTCTHAALTRHGAAAAASQSEPEARTGSTLATRIRTIEPSADAAHWHAGCHSARRASAVCFTACQEPGAAPSAGEHAQPAQPRRDSHCHCGTGPAAAGVQSVGFHRIPPLPYHCRRGNFLIAYTHL